MSLSKSQRDAITTTIKNSLQKKFSTYQQKPVIMPFHTRLLGQDRLALYSFIHSLNTNFGTTIFEPVAKLLASYQFKVVKTQLKVGTTISSGSQSAIQSIMNSLSTASKKPNKREEIEVIKKSFEDGDINKVKSTKIDLYLEDYQGNIYLFDLKTAKPNKSNFKDFKRTLLEWAAIYLLQNPELKNPETRINTLIAIPYNPDEPKPYSRWTMVGMIDIKNELKVGKEFWDFLGGVGAYEDLLECFEQAGIEMREMIDDYFKQFLNKA